MPVDPDHLRALERAAVLLADIVGRTAYWVAEPDVMRVHVPLAVLEEARVLLAGARR